MVDERKRHPLQPRTWSQGSNLHRYEAIRPYLAGRTVLDVGCATGQHRSDWLHALVAGAAAQAVGIDLDENLVRGAVALGYDVRVGSAETLRLDRTFDVVFAGELIEHLGRPAAFLEAARRHLVPEGVLLLTTPNAFSVSNFVYRFGGKVRTNEDHVCWYCEDTLRNLFDRAGFAADIRYLAHATPGAARRIGAGIARRMVPRRLRWNTLFAVARPR